MRDISKIFDAISDFKKDANKMDANNNKKEVNNKINNKLLLQGVFTQQKMKHLFSQSLAMNDDLFE